MIVLIPAYEPDQRLTALLGWLADAPVAGGSPVVAVVVDDGSGTAYAPVFEHARRLGADVLVHATNRGKGAALRTGLAHIARAYPGHDVVCADSDGQHTPGDIARVAAELARHDASTMPHMLPDTVCDMVLGVRRFTGRVPLRSKLGNEATRLLFRAVTRVPVTDTQTGLRGYPARMIPWLLAVPGDRFEYELALLLRAARERLTLVEVPIETIYLEENASSHFRPLIDSTRIYGRFAAFGISSLIGFALDVALLAVLYAVTGRLLVSIVGARLVSASVNFCVNRWWVFGSAGRATPLRVAAVRYAVLAGALLAANALLMRGLVAALGSLWVAKLLTEALLFVVSFTVQRLGIFRARAALTPPPIPVRFPVPIPTVDSAYAADRDISGGCRVAVGAADVARAVPGAIDADIHRG